MSEIDRILTYPQAIKEASRQLMIEKNDVVVMGQGVDDPIGILGTTLGLQQEFGIERVFDTPIAEEGMTGVAIGMALAGLRPIHVHIRMDFLLLAFNQLINVAAKTHYMFGGQHKVPLVIRCAIGKSWGQGAQHSQALHSLLMHIPGLKVVMPSTAHDAKGCLINASRDDNPVIMIEHRMLYYQESYVPENMYECLQGKARIVQRGKDITIVAISHMQLEAFRASAYLKEKKIEAEVIDPIWLKPLDIDTIISSLKKTKNLLIVDNGWLNCGASSEIIAQIVERWNENIMPKIARLGYASTPCPTTPALEELFYPNACTIAKKAYEMLEGNSYWDITPIRSIEQKSFKGPF